jgi:predicted transglutaminase-like cysteine proteinase
MHGELRVYCWPMAIDLALCLWRSGDGLRRRLFAGRPPANARARADERRQDRASIEMVLIKPAKPFVSTDASSEPFGLVAVPVKAGELLTKWEAIRTDIRVETKVLARCRAHAELCPPAAQHFLAFIAEGRSRSGLARIGVINRAINLAIRPVSDLAQWGAIDRWSAPIETLATGRGDCEDYAIAKYVALKAAGIPDDDLRIVILHNFAVGEDHAIVAARLDGAWITLDNRWLMLVKDSEMRRVVPLFALDGVGVKRYLSTQAQQTLSAIPSLTGNSQRAVGFAK